MKRYAIRLVLFLLLGAVVNVAVAWGIEIRPARSPRSVTVATWKENDEKNWTILVRYTSSCHILTSEDAHFADCFLDGLTGRATGRPDISQIADLATYPAWSFPRHPDWQQAPPLERVADDRAVGWPLWSVRYRVIGQIGGPDRQIRGGIRIPPKIYRQGRFTGYHHRALAFTPIWPGFAINTIFYAGVLWLLFAIPGVVKRIRRRRRGLCLHCGYDLRGQPPGSDKCPECGRNA